MLVYRSRFIENLIGEKQMEQENLYKWYNELADEDKWETKSFKVSLAKRMLMIESKDGTVRLVLDLRTKTND